MLDLSTLVQFVEADENPGPPALPPMLPWLIILPDRGASSSVLGPPIATDPGELLNAIKAMIVATGEYTPFQVNITLHSQPFPVSGQKQVLIIPQVQRDSGAAFDGGGRDVNLVWCSFKLIFLSQQARDFNENANLALASGSFGSYLRINGIIDQLVGEFVYNGDGYCLTVEPLRHGYVGIPQPYGDSFEWSGTPTDWSVLYRRRLRNSSEQ